MRTTIVRRTVAVLGAAAVVSAAVVGCSSDDDGGDASSSTSSESSASSSESTSAPSSSSEEAAAEQDPAVVQSVTDAYVGFFDAAAPIDQRIALVQNGENFRPILERQASNPQGQTTAVVHSVTVSDETNAAVNYDLVIGGTPALPDQNGEAVLEAGQWKVAAITFCTLASIQSGGGGAIPGC